MLGVLIIKLINRRRGQPVNDVAFGFGDVNLSGVLGLMLGWPLDFGWVGGGSIDRGVGELDLYPGDVGHPKVPGICCLALWSFPGAGSGVIDLFPGSGCCTGRGIISFGFR